VNKIKIALTLWIASLVLIIISLYSIIIIGFEAIELFTVTVAIVLELLTKTNDDLKINKLYNLGFYLFYIGLFAALYVYFYATGTQYLESFLSLLLIITGKGINIKYGSDRIIEPFEEN